MCEEFNKALVEASIRTFVVYFEKKIQVFNHMVLDSKGSPSEICSLIGLNGFYTGVLMFKCSFALALIMAKKIHNKDLVESSPEVNDTIGEILNTISGSAKKNINCNGEPYLISTPMVVGGSNYGVFNIHNQPINSIKFMYDKYNFFIEYFLRNPK